MDIKEFRSKQYFVTEWTWRTEHEGEEI